MSKLHAEFIGSFSHITQIPKLRLPEIAFAGRSNVGKSSLINCLLGRKNMAKTSSTPGKTRQLNYISINSRFYFVDLPGYGFAKVSKSERDRWARLIEQYFSDNTYLRKVIGIIDIRHGPTESDQELINWLVSLKIPLLLVATKSDKLKRNELAKAERRIATTIGALPVDGPIIFSSTKGTGKKELWRAINRVLEH